MFGDLWTAAFVYYGLAVVSAVIPWVNAELVMISAIPVANSPSALAALVVVVSAGQMTGQGCHVLGVAKVDARSVTARTACCRSLARATPATAAIGARRHFSERARWLSPVLHRVARGGRPWRGVQSILRCRRGRPSRALHGRGLHPRASEAGVLKPLRRVPKKDPPYQLGRKNPPYW